MVIFSLMLPFHEKNRVVKLIGINFHFCRANSLRQRLSSLGAHRGSVISTRTNLEAIVEFSAAAGAGAVVPNRRPRTTSSNSELSQASSDVFHQTTPNGQAVAAANALLRKATMNNMMRSEAKPAPQVGGKVEQAPARGAGTCSQKPPLPGSPQPKTSYAKEKKISFKLHDSNKSQCHTTTSNGN